MGVKINGRNGNFLIKFNLTKQGSHDTTGRTCCGVRFLAGNFAPKMHLASVRCLPSIYCFCFGLQFINALEKLINGGEGGGVGLIKLREVGKYRKFNKQGGGGRLFGT